MVDISVRKKRLPGRRIQPGDSRLRQIIKAATALFVKKGYLKTTVREIARHSGITVGTLYHYVTSKDEILSLIQEEESSAINELIQETQKALSQLGPVEALRLAIKLYISYVDEIQDRVLFWYHESGNLQSGQRAKLIRNDELIAETFEKILVAGCQSGEFRPHDTKLVSHNIIVLGDMWAFRRWFLRKHCNASQFAQKQSDFILHSLCQGNHQTDGKKTDMKKRNNITQQFGDD